MANRQTISVTEESGIARQGWPVTQGVPLPEGALEDLASVWIEDGRDTAVPAQFRVLSRWPDGSLKWVLADFRADVPAEGTAEYAFCYGDEPPPAPEADALRVEEDADRIVVCTGPLQFAVNRKRFSFLESVTLGQVGPDGQFVAEEEVGSGGEAWVRICESSIAEDGSRFVYGMGGDCLASLAGEVYEAVVEEAGPLRVVIRCAGAFEADLPSHHYAGYRPFRFVIRIYAYAGQATLRVLHTLVVACNPRETAVEEVGLRVPVGLSGPVRFRTGLSVEEGLEADESVLLSQRVDNHFRLDRRQAERVRTVAEGERAPAWMAVENDRVGVGVGLRYMAEEYPKALLVRGAGDGIDAYFWRDPDGKQLQFKRYAEAVAWDQGEGVYSDGVGTAKTSECFVHVYPARDRETVGDRLTGWLEPLCTSVDPAWASACAVTGGFAPCDPERFPESEQMMAGYVEWMARNIRVGRWYGFFNWGDVLAAWEESESDWRFYGRWGWCNSEWDPRHGVWVQFLRTGEGSYFRLGEAMTRHSVDVDTCHYHPFRPYMVGGCFRHSVDHFGDEPCASHTFLDNWVDYYYLTGDLRTFEVLKEAGDFFMRYRWTEDSAFSFSLRSIANVLRGLLYVYEVTGEAHYMERAEAVYEVIARGQNPDGSWHKRFQVSTPDRLSGQGPYGMATEGTTMAVELGTAAPFTEAEFRNLRGTDRPQTYVLPLSEQKGYQTHYLMIGLDLLHRMTGRDDVAEVYCRAVDWFCGGARDAGHAIREHYGGVVCRHLGYAYRLTGDRSYLEIGRTVLQHLIDHQDWSDDPKRRGAVSMSPTHLSTLFFGVPFLLGTMVEAEMSERDDKVRRE